MTIEQLLIGAAIYITIGAVISGIIAGYMRDAGHIPADAAPIYLIVVIPFLWPILFVILIAEAITTFIIWLTRRIVRGGS